LDSDDGTIVPISESSETLGEGRYKKLAKLGRGAFGEVWRVFDSKLGVDLAVKLLPEDMLNEDSESYFEREVHKTRELSHENIVRIYDLHLFPGEPPFLTMELIDGHNLETERLRRAGDIFPWEELQPLVGQLCNAVGYIHEKGIVHRDIKPANIVLTREGQVKLGDFGCARSMIISIITLKQLAKNPNLPLMGTMAYMSKQTLEGEKPDAADDIYSIGAMLYEMLTGETPFSWDQSQEQLMQEIIDTDPLPPGAVFVQRDKTNPIPDHVSGMIMKCLSKDPAQRPASASMIAKVFC
jgi:serine/threonine protein kinase